MGSQEDRSQSGNLVCGFILLALTAMLLVGVPYLWSGADDKDGANGRRYAWVSTIPSGEDFEGDDYMAACEKGVRDGTHAQEGIDGCTDFLRISDWMWTRRRQKLKDDLASRIYGWRCIHYMDVQKYDEAKADCDESLKQGPFQLFAYNALGVLHHKKKEYSEALNNFNKAIELSSEWRAGLPLGNRGMVRVDMGDLPDGIADLTLAMGLMPKDSRLYHYRAIAYLKSDKHDLALKDNEQALKLEPDSASYWGLKAQIMESKGEKQEAIDDFKKALHLNPYLKEAQEGLHRLGVQT
jgi:tetratricopeptide (TPR) repeat protein